MRFVRSGLFVVRLIGQVVGFAVAGRRLALGLVLVAAPLLVLVAAVVGVASPWVVYPFL